MEPRGQTHLRNCLFIVACIVGVWVILRYEPAPAEPKPPDEMRPPMEIVAEARRQCEDFRDPRGLRRLAMCLTDQVDAAVVLEALAALRELTGRWFLPADRSVALASPAVVERLRHRWLAWIARNERAFRWDEERGRFEVDRETASRPRQPTH